jgi:hypothetical protein
VVYRKLTYGLGLPLNSTNAAIASVAAGENPQLRQRILQALDESDQLLAREKMSEKSLLNIIQQFKAIERDTHHG